MTKAKSSDIPAMWRKDFKITGSIGEGGLSFTSLIRQIDAGITKGYTEHEIVEGVIKAIAPGNKLRSYLEGIAKIELLTLRQILHSHYKEAPAIELYKMLCNVTQRVNEDTMDFLTRCLDLKQKVIAASKMETDVKYDSVLVQQMFLHAFYTGLRNDSIRHQLKDILTKDISDVEIMQLLNRILLTETEHDSKVSAKKVNSISYDDELSKLKQEVEQLRVQYISSNKPNSRDSEKAKDTKKSSKCDSCVATGAACNHCFKCGSDNHFARGCRKMSGNRQ